MKQDGVLIIQLASEGRFAPACEKVHKAEAQRFQR